MLRPAESGLQRTDTSLRITRRRTQALLPSVIGRLSSLQNRCILKDIRHAPHLPTETVSHQAKVSARKFRIL